MAKSKREIDKEVMFNKIMPSNLIKNHLNNDVPSSDTDNSKNANLKPVNTIQPDNKNKPGTAPAALGNDKKISFIRHRKTVMINVMEKIVAEKLDEAFNKFNCCKCDKCRQDVAALALNKLPPKYVIAEENEIEQIISQQDDSAVNSAIIQAILMVRAHPRH